MQSVRNLASQIIAAVALALLLIYFMDVLTSMLTNEPGFLPFTSKDRGLLFGGLSIALFLISFVVGWKLFPSLQDLVQKFNRQRT